MFGLAPWEHFDAPINAQGDVARITLVWVDEEQRRIYGQSPQLAEPVWLHPDRVPGRVIRGDTSIPRPPGEWREIIRAGHKAIEDDAEAALAARLEAIPEPEVRARPATLEEMPRTMVSLGKQAAAAGFAQRATFARGPRLNQHWKVVEISDSLQLKGEHPDGRRFVLAYVTKTPGEGTKNAGIPQWKPELGYAMVDGVWTSCGPTALALYITNGSLTQEAL